MFVRTPATAIRAADIMHSHRRLRHVIQCTEPGLLQEIYTALNSSTGFLFSLHYLCNTTEQIKIYAKNGIPKNNIVNIAIGVNVMKSEYTLEYEIEYCIVAYRSKYHFKVDPVSKPE